MIAKASKLHKSNLFMLNYSMRTNSKQGGTQNEKQKRAVRRVVYRRLRATHAVRSTVLQIQVYPKINAPGVSKPQRVAKSDFLLILKIFLTLDDIRPGN